MAIGSVDLQVPLLPGLQRSAADSAPPPAAPDRREANANATPAAATRQEFLLGATGYRRVLATLEPDRDGAVPERIAQRESAGSFTGQRALRAYQDAGSDDNRDNLSTLFGVDLYV